MVDAMALNPRVPYGWIQSKYDETQISFYVAIATTLRIAPVALGPAECYRDANEIFRRYDATPNALHFRQAHVRRRDLVARRRRPAPTNRVRRSSSGSRT